jgi:hypothetical protein
VSWGRAGKLVDPQDEADRAAIRALDDDRARAAIEAALRSAAKADRRHNLALLAFEDFPRPERRSGPKKNDTFTAQLHWTIWLMAQALFDFSVCDCERLVFPYLHSTNTPNGTVYSGWNKHKAARAIIRGLTKADVVRQSNGSRYVIEEPAVRRVIDRFNEKH